MMSEHIRILGRNGIIALELIERHGELTGTQVANLSRGMIDKAFVHTTLHRQEKYGHLISRVAARPRGGRPLRIYTICPKGRLALGLSKSTDSNEKDSEACLSTK